MKYLISSINNYSFEFWQEFDKKWQEFDNTQVYYTPIFTLKMLVKMNTNKAASHFY